MSTLLVFLVCVLAFLLAPLALFGAALVAYLVLRPRGRRPAPSPLGHGFGSGVR